MPQCQIDALERHLDPTIIITFLFIFTSYTNILYNFLWVFCLTSSVESQITSFVPTTPVDSNFRFLLALLNGSDLLTTDIFSASQLCLLFFGLLIYLYDDQNLFSQFLTTLACFYGSLWIDELSLPTEFGYFPSCLYLMLNHLKFLMIASLLAQVTGKAHPEPITSIDWVVPIALK